MLKSIVKWTDWHVSIVTCSKSSHIILETTTLKRCYCVFISRWARRQHSVASCSCNHPTCMNENSIALSSVGCYHNNSVDLYASWCRTLWTVYRCTCWLKSLSRRTWTHKLDLCAVQPSRRVFRLNPRSIRVRLSL